MGTAPVAVVIVTWNSAVFIRPCLESLQALRRPPAEIVVVDNASSDGSAAIAGTFTAVQVIELTENVGFCRANNIGIGRTRAPFVLLLNPDTKVEAGFLEALLPAFEAEAVGLVAGKLLRFDGETIDSAGQELSRSRKPVDRGYGKPDRGQYERDEEVFGACGAAVLCRRTALEQLAGAGGAVLDERFFAFYEDLDLAWRARRRGWTVAYRHRAIAYHHRGGSAATQSLVRRVAMLGRSPDVRFHIVKNRYLTIIRNDTVAGYLTNLPFILARDLATVGLLLVSSPRVLGRLWRHRRLFKEAFAARRLDGAPRGHQVS